MALSNSLCEMLVKMVGDLEDTREEINGWSYVRTMRNILVGKEDAAIAPYFKDKPYFGMFSLLELSDVEAWMEELVEAHKLYVYYTKRGNLYCTPEWYDSLSRNERQRE